MNPRRPAFVHHLFLPADLDRATLQEIWADATRGLGRPIASWPTDPPPAPGHGFLAMQGGEPSAGLREAVLYQVHDVIGIGVLTAPNDGTPWKDLASSDFRHPDLALGTAAIYVGVWPRLAPRALHRLAPGLPGAPHPPQISSAAWSRTPDGVTWWDLPGENDRHRRLLLMSSARDEPAQDGFVWTSTDRTPPPLTRYLLQAARLRHQQGVLEAAWPGLRQAVARTEQAVDVLIGVLRAPEPPAPQVRAARRTIDLSQAEQGGLITAIADAQDMAATVRAATRNLNEALGPDVTTAPTGPVGQDRATAAWLDEQLHIELTYLNSARLRAEGLTRLAGAVVTQAEQHRQESVTIWQTAILGGLVMALAAVQSFQYSVPLPTSVLAPLIAVLAGIAALLPVVVLQRPRRSRPLIAGAALLGAATGWLGASITYRLTDAGAAPVPASIAAALGTATVLGTLTWA